MTNSLQSLALDDDDTWPRITSLYYSGRDREALVVLKQLYGECLCDDPLSAIQKLPSGQSEYDILFYISEILFWCDEYRAALSLYKHSTDNSISDRRDRIADCYRELGDYDKAVTVLESIPNKSASVYYSLGQTCSQQKEYKKSESAYLQALELDYADISSEKQYDYYGDLIETDEPTDSKKVSFTTITSPKEKLSRIINSSPGVIVCVASLGNVYRDQGQYTIAESYYKKSLYLISELYGEGAAVPSTADTLYNLGINYNEMGQYSEAVDSYKQALAIYRNLSQGSDSSDVACTLYYLGINYSAMGQYSEAEDSYKQALAIYRNLSKSGDSSDIAGTLYNLGINYRAMGHYSEAEDSYKHALAIYRNLSKSGDSSDIANTLHNLGTNYAAMQYYNEAEDSYKQALAIYRNLSKSADSRDIACTLNNLGTNYAAMRYYNEAEDSYKQALAIYRNLSKSADNEDIANTLNNLAINYGAMQHYNEAEDSYKQLLAIYRKLTPGAESSDIANTLKALGVVCMYSGQYNRAEECFQDSLAMLKKLPQDIISIGFNLINLTVNSRMMGQNNQADDYHEQTAAAIRDLSDADICSVLQDFIQNADRWSRTGEFKVAEEVYMHCLIMSRRLSCGADSSDTADILQKLGDTYRAAGDENKAVEPYREALDMYRTVDPDNEQISIIRLYLPFYTGSSDDVGITESTTSNSDTQKSTSVTPTSSDTNIQSSISHTETPASSHDQVSELSPPQTKYRKTIH